MDYFARGGRLDHDLTDALTDLQRFGRLRGRAIGLDRPTTAIEAARLDSQERNDLRRYEASTRGKATAEHAKAVAA